MLNFRLKGNKCYAADDTQKNLPQEIENTREIIQNMSEIFQNISDIFFALSKNIENQSIKNV